MVEVPNCHLVQPVSRWQPIAAATMGCRYGGMDCTTLTARSAPNSALTRCSFTCSWVML